MKKLKEITGKYQTMYQAGKALEKNPQQLQRWLDNDALVDVDGNIYIKTKGKIKFN